MPATTVKVLTLRAAEQNKLQALAVGLHRADKRIEKGESERAKVKTRLFPLLDKMFGEDVGVIFEARGPIEGQRMVRQIGWSSVVDYDGLKAALDPDVLPSVTAKLVVLKDIDTIRGLVPPDVFETITETQESIDPQKLEAALSFGLVSADVVSDFVEWKAGASMALRASGPRSQIKLNAGQVAITERNGVSAGQEE